MIETNDKKFLKLGEIQFLGNLEPEKKPWHRELIKLKDKIDEDGSFTLDEHDEDLLKKLARDNPRYKKKINSLLDTIQTKFQTKTPYKEFIPEEFNKIQKKFYKLTEGKKFKKWIETESEDPASDSKEVYHTNKLDSILPSIQKFAKSINIKHKVLFYKFEKHSVLNFNYQYSVVDMVLKVFIPEEVEEYFTEEELLKIGSITLSRYILKIVHYEKFQTVGRKLNTYYGSEPKIFKEELIQIFGKKWEEFLFYYYSISQFQELILDRITLFFLGDKDLLINLYSKMNDLKEYSFDTDGEIFLVEDLWGEESFGRDIDSPFPGTALRNRFIHSYLGPAFHGKEQSRYKFWNLEEKKYLKDYFNF